MIELKEQDISKAEIVPFTATLSRDLQAFYAELQDRINQTFAKAIREGWDADRTIDEVGKLMDTDIEEVQHG